MQLTIRDQKQPGPISEIMHRKLPSNPYSMWNFGMFSFV